MDGVVGEATYRALKEASYRLGARTLYHQFGAPLYGDDVATLQARLQDLGFYTGLVDGHFGLQTHNALMSYQREYGLSADGICGPETLRSLYFLSSRVSGGSPHAIREEELVRSSGPKLSGKRIIIDPGRGGGDHGLITQGPDGPISEADVLWDLASRLEGRMTAIGMETFLSRPTNRSPSDAERAATANSVGADLMISLRCETQSSPAASGVASFHFGNSHGSVSTIGRNLADFIQREVVARTGLRDCRVHGRTWDLLRLTRMPTVQVDVGYITNPRDREMLVSTQTRDAIAEGMLAAVKRLYLLGKNDRPTGTFTFAELLAHELSVERSQQDQRLLTLSGLALLREFPLTSSAFSALLADDAPTGSCSWAFSSRRSSAASTSAFHPSPLSSSRRSRGKYGCAPPRRNPRPTRSPRR